MTTTTDFSKEVAQQIEFAGFGPCAAVGSVVVVQAFDGLLRYPILNGSLALSKSKWKFPHKLSAVTTAVLGIIDHAYVSRGMPAPGQSSAVRVESDEIPFSVEVRYLWLTNPKDMTRNVMALLFDGTTPLWATESEIPYANRSDANLSKRIQELLETYAADHPAPRRDVLEIIPEILDTVNHL